MDSNPKAPTLVSLSATQRTPSPPLEVSSSPGNSSLRIRALPSPDSDTETAIKHKSDSSSGSSSCSSSSDSEEESMGLVVKGEEAMGSSDLPSPMPKAQLSGDFDDNEVLGSDEEDDGFSGVVVRIPSVVEAPKVRVLGDEEGEQGVSSGLNGELGIASNGSELIGDDKLIERPVFVLNPGNREMGSEGKRYGLEQIAVSDSGLVALVGDGVIGGDSSIANASKVSEAIEVDRLLENSVFKNPESEVLSEEGKVEEKKSEVLSSDRIEGDLFLDAEQPEENEFSDAREVEDTMEQNSVLDQGSGAPTLVYEELHDSKLVEVHKGVNDDLPTETNLSGLEIGVVEEVGRNILPATEALEPEVEGRSNVGTESDQAINVDLKLIKEGFDVAKVFEPCDLGVTYSEQNFEPETNSELGIQEEKHQELKSEVEEVGKDDEKKDGVIDANVLIDQNNNTVEPEFRTDTTAAQNEVVDVDEPADSNSAERKLPTLIVGSEGAFSSSSHAAEPAAPASVLEPEEKEEVEHEVDHHEKEDNGAVLDEDTEDQMLAGSEIAQQFMKAFGRGSDSGSEDFEEHSQRIDGQFVMDSDEDTDDKEEEKELFDSAALNALLRAANSAGSEGGNVTVTSSDGSRLFSVERPAGLGSSIRSLKPAPRPNQTKLVTPLDHTVQDDSESDLSEEERTKLEKIQLIRVKFLRLVHRLGQYSNGSIAAQVLYRLDFAAGRHTSRTFSIETAKSTAMQLEEEGKDGLDFSLNILVLGKTGVGKSATINSIFGEERVRISAFGPGTTEVKEIVGSVGGVKLRVLDTPGLRSSVMDQGFNRKVLMSVKKFTKKCPPDIVLYVDRLDSQTRNRNDLPLLKSITNTLGSSIWKNAVVTLTHAASAPPEGPSGTPLIYDMFVAQGSHIVQQSIGQAVGDLRMMNPSFINPVSLVENHESCRKNREGQKILPNGQVWRSQLLIVCYSLKILSEMSSLSKPQDLFDHRKLFGFQVRSPPLPYLLSSLLQSRPHPKLPNDQGVENVDSDIDLEDLADSEQEEEEDEYDQLPPFKPLKKAQLAKLSKDQRKAYFEEYHYRVKLLQKKQWKEELKRMKEMKKRGKNYAADYVNMEDDVYQENEGTAAVPVPLPDMALPPSFDGDNASHRYRFLEPTSQQQLLTRPVMSANGWDHDCGFDTVSLEQNLAIASRFPAGVAVQITKDKKEFNIHLDSSIAAKHGENGSSLAGFDIQNIGKQLAYIVRGETKFKKFKKNKMGGGISVTFLGENVVTGLKVEDQITIGKRLSLAGSTGAIRSKDDVAYGANFEASLKDKDYPIGQDESTLGLSLMKWRGDLALGANLQSQFSIGQSSKMAVRVGLNNKLSGQITVRTSSSEQLQLALVAILPIAMSIYRSIWPEVGESYAAY